MPRQVGDKDVTRDMALRAADLTDKTLLVTDDLLDSTVPATIK